MLRFVRSIFLLLYLAQVSPAGYLRRGFPHRPAGDSGAPSVNSALFRSPRFDSRHLHCFICSGLFGAFFVALFCIDDFRRKNAGRSLRGPRIAGLRRRRLRPARLQRSHSLPLQIYALRIATITVKSCEYSRPPRPPPWGGRAGCHGNPIYFRQYSLQNNALQILCQLLLQRCGPPLTEARAISEKPQFVPTDCAMHRVSQKKRSDTFISIGAWYIGKSKTHCGKLRTESRSVFPKLAKTRTRDPANRLGMSALSPKRYYFLFSMPYPLRRSSRLSRIAKIMAINDRQEKIIIGVV